MLPREVCSKNWSNLLTYGIKSGNAEAAQLELDAMLFSSCGMFKLWSDVLPIMMSPLHGDGTTVVTVISTFLFLQEEGPIRSGLNNKVKSTTVLGERGSSS